MPTKDRSPGIRNKQSLFKRGAGCFLLLVGLPLGFWSFLLMTDTGSDRILGVPQPACLFSLLTAGCFIAGLLLILSTMKLKTRDGYDFTSLPSSMHVKDDE
jgi:hypothetical protein